MTIFTFIHFVHRYHGLLNNRDHVAGQLTTHLVTFLSAAPHWEIFLQDSSRGVHAQNISFASLYEIFSVTALPPPLSELKDLSYKPGQEYLHAIER